MSRKIDQLAATWPHKWFGFFDAPPKNQYNLPQFADFVEANWLDGERDKVVGYLKNADCVLAGGMPHVKCSLCDEKVSLASFRSDGVWLWPTLLAHDVERHEIRLPDEFLKKIREDNYIPSPCEISHEKLPWPES